MKKIFIILTSLLLVTTAADAKKKKKSKAFITTGTVVDCHDGDTCRVQTKQKVLKVRFSGIDAPELKQTEGPMARQYLLSLVKGKEVKLDCKGESFDRVTCDVYQNEQFINEQMVRAGMAFDAPLYSKGQYKQLMQQAREQKIGIWKTIERSPSCYRHKKKDKCLRDPLSLE